MELNINDFEKHNTENYYQLKDKNLNVFSKILASDRIKLRVQNEESLNNHLKSLSLFLIKISNFKDELINFYNNDFEF